MGYRPIQKSVAIGQIYIKKFSNPKGVGSLTKKNYKAVFCSQNKRLIFE